MPWRLDAPPDQPIIEMVYFGDITAPELSEGVGAVLALARARGLTRVLTDCTATTSGPSLGDLYFSAESVRSSDIGLAMREALLVPDLPAVAQTVEFWETTCRNRGLDSRVFTDRRQAVAWLLD